MLLFNLLKNSVKGGYLKVMITKLFKRLEQNTSSESIQWAKKNVSYSTEKFCKFIDKNLWEETLFEMNVLKNDANKILSEIQVDLGGGGNYFLLYFLVRKVNPQVVVETGVAAGWSSLSILRAFQKSGFGKLYSSDFRYFRLNQPENYIGIVTKKEKNLLSWDLDVSGDRVALPSIKSKVGKLKIDFFHYDSDKSYSGRSMAFNVLKGKL